MKKLIIIPAYNEAKNLENVVKNIKENAPSFDYVIINDCSTDQTKELCAQKGFNVVNLPVNLGIGGAVQTGYVYGVENDYDLAVQVDGDGQHDPAFLEKMSVVLQEEKAEMVIGSRFIDNQGFQSTGMRRMGIKYFSGLIYLLTKKRVTDPTSGLRMINKDIIRLFSKDYPKDYPEPESIVAVLRRNKKIVEIPVEMKERQGGVSSISPKKSVYYMIKVSLAILIEGIRKY
ncbi:MAG: glycosyltransferase family 2 protein [Hespellia sp.]|nr:glycosyltransferase family 2 protein [Hespellia sp.]